MEQTQHSAWDVDPDWTGVATITTPSYTIESLTGAVRSVKITRHGLDGARAVGDRWNMGVGQGRAVPMEVVRANCGGTEVSVGVGAPFDCDEPDWSPL